MVTLRVELVGMLSSQVALPLVSPAVLPLTTAVLPTNPSAWVDCAVCCKDTSVASESLVLSCCWTPANSTSCWVNWLVSSGSSGFWFCNCVVSSCRKLWKFPAICWEAKELADDADELEDEPAGNGVVPETIGLAVVADVPAMLLSLHCNIHAAVCAEHAAIGAAGRRRCGRGIFADNQTLRVAVVGLAAAVLVEGRLVAQR